MKNELVQELETYEKNKPELLSHDGEYVIIQGSDIIGFWKTYQDAIKVAYEKFGIAKKFLVKQIEVNEQVHFLVNTQLCHF
jgi:hypothetical protein